MKEVTIDRSIWRTGDNSRNKKTGVGSISLLNDAGYMCCLGMYCQQEGIPKEKLLGYRSPDQLGRLIPKLTIKHGECAVVNNTEFAGDCMTINDTGETSPQEKEERLYELGQENGVEFIFINDY